MEAVIFVGLQAAGKTTFYRQRFGTTHVRISLDQLKTRSRERATLSAAIQAGKSFVVDNTNPTVEERRKYIQPAKAAGYMVRACFFEPDISGSLQRNASRPAKQRIPLPGLFGTKKRLEPPCRAEGFDEVWGIRVGEGGTFVVEVQEPHERAS